MHPQAIQQLEDHSTTDLTMELGGALLGKSHSTRERLSIEIDAALPVTTADRGPVHFTFTADSWAQLHKERAEHYPTLDIVGWYHTHPDIGVFFSPDDVVVHSAAFVLPWHIGLVIDPVRLECCAVGWQLTPPDSEPRQLVDIGGFYEILKEDETTVITWRVVRSAIWQPGGNMPLDYESSRQIYAPDNDWPLLPPISPWWGVLLGGLSLLISLLLLLERILAAAG